MKYAGNLNPDTQKGFGVCGSKIRLVPYRNVKEGERQKSEGRHLKGLKLAKDGFGHWKVEGCLIAYNRHGKR